MPCSTQRSPPTFDSSLPKTCVTLPNKLEATEGFYANDPIVQVASNDRSGNLSGVNSGGNFQRNCCEQFYQQSWGRKRRKSDQLGAPERFQAPPHLHIGKMGKA